MGEGIVHVESSAAARLGIGQRQEGGDPRIEPHQQADGTEQARSASLRTCLNSW
jgi:hypothetical protein